MVPFLFTKESCFFIADMDLTAWTCQYFIQMTMESNSREMTLTELYGRLENHLK